MIEKKTLRLTAGLLAGVFYSATALFGADGVIAKTPLMEEISAAFLQSHGALKAMPSVDDVMSVDASNTPATIDSQLLTASISNEPVLKRSLQLNTRPSLNNSTDSQDFAELPPCMSIPAPAASLATQSKYVQSDTTKSTVDEAALEERNKVVQPIRDSIRTLTQIAYAESDNAALQASRAACVISNVKTWAKAGSLTDMGSTDAILSRDRLMAEITLAYLQAIKLVSPSEDDRAAIDPWMSVIGKNTVENYTYRLGDKSKMNNHRYWAGLSVAAIGYATKTVAFSDWGKRSFDIGVCQVDSNGFLPLELARGKKALEYHVYALRPLLAIEKLSANNGDAIQPKCGGRFEKLLDKTESALKDMSIMEQASGYVQEFGVKERSFSKGLQLASLGLPQ